jgi:NADH dehydrogenase
MTRLITVFGGSGFVGRHVVQALAKRGWRVRVAVRRPDLAGHVQPMGIVGQVMPVQANLRYPDSVAHAVKGADGVVNLVGILHESGRQSFGQIQGEGPGVVAAAAARAGIRDVVHVSAIGADPESPAAYARSKALGEQALLREAPQAVILRPSVVFGPEDDFFNRFAAMARLAPALPLIGGGETRFQPVFVGDVAEAAALALEGKAKPGAIYELGGPEVKSFRQILEYILEQTNRSKPLIPIPFEAAEFLGRILGFLPKPPLTRDQVLLLRSDNVVSEAARQDGRTLEGLGIKPDSIEAVVPGYLYRYRPAGQFDREKSVA